MFNFKININIFLSMSKISVIKLPSIFNILADFFYPRHDVPKMFTYDHSRQALNLFLCTYREIINFNLCHPCSFFVIQYQINK